MKDATTQPQGVGTSALFAVGLAERIADRLLTIRCTGVKCHRIALKSGSYPDGEMDEGGLCRGALINEIQAALDDTANDEVCRPARQETQTEE